MGQVVLVVLAAAQAAQEVIQIKQAGHPANILMLFYIWAEAEAVVVVFLEELEVLPPFIMVVYSLSMQFIMVMLVQQAVELAAALVVPTVIQVLPLHLVIT